VAVQAASWVWLISVYRWFEARTLVKELRQKRMVFLATQEAEIRKMEIQSQPQANSSQDPILKKLITKKGWWSGLMCRP
jgi:hypothetical protein